VHFLRVNWQVLAESPDEGHVADDMHEQVEPQVSPYPALHVPPSHVCPCVQSELFVQISPQAFWPGITHVPLEHVPDFPPKVQDCPFGTFWIEPYEAMQLPPEQVYVAYLCLHVPAGTIPFK
jgi:hypothetical protein